VKLVKLEITFTCEEAVPDDWDDDTIQYHFEENHCIGNYIVSEKVEIDQHPDRCNICHRATVKVLEVTSAQPSLAIAQSPRIR